MADLTPTKKPANDVDLMPHAKRRKLRKYVLGFSLFLTVLGPLIFVFAPVGYKVGLIDLRTALFTLTREIGPMVLIAGAVVALISLLLALLIKPRKGIVIGIIGLLVPLFGGLQLKKSVDTFASVPFIHDVTTDTQDVPVFGAVIMAERAGVERVNTADYIGKTAPVYEGGKPTGETALVSVLQTKAFPEISPLVLSDSKDVVFGRALATAKSMGWKIKEEDLAAGRIDATDTTFWYGFDDDVTIRLRESEGGGTIVDVRSLSRIGGSDLGKNAERVSAFLKRLAT